MMQSKQIIASLFSNSFEHVSNMMGMGCLGLAWAGETKFVFLSKSFPWQRYVFQEPQSSWLKITLLTVLHVQLFIHLANYFRSTEPFCFSIGVLHSKCLDNLVFASLVWNIDYQGIVNHKVVMDCWDWRKFLGIISTSLEFRICYRISNCQVCIYSINYWFNQYYSGVFSDPLTLSQSRGADYAQPLALPHLKKIVITPLQYCLQTFFSKRKKKEKKVFPNYESFILIHTLNLFRYLAFINASP